MVQRYQEAAEAESRSNGQLCSAELDSLRASAQLHKVPLCNNPAGNPGANPKSISHRCFVRGVAFEWELT